MKIAEVEQPSIHLKQQKEVSQWSIFESLSEGLTVINLQGNIIQANKAFVHFLGYSNQVEILGRRVSELIAPEERLKFLRKIQDISLEEHGGTIEIIFVRKEGSNIPTEAAASIILDASNTPQGIVLIIRDKSVLNKAQVELTQLYNEEKKLRQASENELKTRIEFFKAVIHELKTPLTSMLLSSESMISLSQNDTCLKSVQNSLQGAVRLSQHIDELLDFSSGTLGMLKVNCEPLDIVTLIKNVAEYLQPRMDDNLQHLLLDLPEHLPMVIGDESRLCQVLVNLLENAIKFTPALGTITIKAISDEDNILVKIQYNGQGIDVDEQTQLFHTYNQIGSDKPNYSGLKSGLALSRQLIELQGGRIWFISHEGQGSAFNFTLKVVKQINHPVQLLESFQS